MSEKKYCEICGKEITNNNYHEVDGDYVCEGCFDENYAECVECGKIYKKDEMRTTADGDYICEDCFDAHYFVCEDCGEIYNVDDLVEVYDDYGNVVKYVCERCCSDYYCCEDCGRYFNYDLNYIENYGYVCNDCYSRGDYFQCEECYQYFRCEDGHYSESMDRWYCNECRANELISDYHSHENELEFFGDNKKNSIPYLGVELEIDKCNNNDECAEYTRDCLPDNFIYFEYDGSLSEGFENITQPATMEYHYSLKENYQKAFKNAVNMGYRSHDTNTCGLHVHFNRDFYRDDEDLYVTRLLYLVDKFWDNLVKFSRRDLYDLDRWAKKYESSPEDVVNVWKHSRYGLDRYQAVNLTNQNTIEFRMFKGTLNIDTFMATLQLCNELITIVKKVSCAEELAAIKWDDLIAGKECQEYWNKRKEM